MNDLSRDTLQSFAREFVVLNARREAGEVGENITPTVVERGKHIPPTVVENGENMVGGIPHV